MIFAKARPTQIISSPLVIMQYSCIITESLSFAEQDNMQKMCHGWEERNTSQLSMPDPMVLEKEQKQSKTLYLSNV